MPYETIVSTSDLAAHLDDPNWVIVDCRFSFTDIGLGRRNYLQAHIPGAVYAHLDDDLSSPPIPGETGRHPLPSVDVMARTFSNWGIDSKMQVVAYDDWPLVSGATAARLWWCLHWLGHEAAAVLDGGWQHWLRSGGSSQSGLEARSPRVFKPQPRPELLASLMEVDSMRSDPAYLVLDSRAADRYRGENETIDPVAGHIPGTLNAPFAENAGPDGLFLPGEALRKRFRALLGDIPSQNAVFYCGSGVTAAYNLLALQHAGLGEGKLYAGSWSEWITDLGRPVAKG